MLVVCTDGTTFPCESYEVIDAGVMLFGEEHEEESEENRYASDKEQIGYVPHTALLYIVPDGVTVGAAGGAQQVQQIHPTQPGQQSQQTQPVQQTSQPQPTQQTSQPQPTQQPPHAQSAQRTSRPFGAPRDEQGAQTGRPPAESTQSRTSPRSESTQSESTRSGPPR